MQLYQNGLLRRLVREFADAPPIDEAVMDRFFALEARPWWLSEVDFGSFLSELWLRTRLEELAQNYRWRIINQPIVSGASTKHYIFGDCFSGLSVRRKRDGKIRSQLDALALIDGLPVLFEIKLCGYRLNGSCYRAHGSVVRNMRDERADFLSRPIREFFGTYRTGYVLVLSNDQIKDNSPIQEDFKGRGGLLVPFYIDKDSFRRFEVPALFREYDLERVREYDFVESVG